jgi:hypothetical protein
LAAAVAGEALDTGARRPGPGTWFEGSHPDYSTLDDGVSNEGIVSRECFLQLSQARNKHDPLKTLVSVTEFCPTGWDKARTSGLNTTAAAARAAVVVYFVPVSFW